MFGAILYLLLIGFSPFGNWLTEFDAVAKRMPHIYFSQNTRAALKWIQDNIPRNATILAPLDTAVYLPGFTGKIVYAGHGVETAFYYCCKEREVRWFFKPNTPNNARAAFLKKRNITYIAVSKEPFLKESMEERVFYNTVNSLDQLSYLQKMFFNESVVIYQVFL